MVVRLVLCALAASAVAVFLILKHDSRSGRSPAGTEASRPALAPAPAIPAVQEHSQVISSGTTIAEILAAHGMTAGETHALREQVKSVYDLGRIRAGHRLRFRNPAGGAWTSFDYDIDENSYLVVRRTAGSFQAEIKPFPYEFRTAFLWTSIEDNPIAAVNEAGEDDFLALELSDVFGSDIDFHTDIRKGDSFRIIYEKKFLDGKFSGYRNVLAAEFTNQGKTYRAFRYTYPDTGKSDYFDADGNSLRKEFLKSPMKFGRITSRFTSSRFHPIRKIYRPHYGVDYAAPIGSPVQATGDGTVTAAGWNGGAGRMVKIRHANGYETSYLHLSRIVSGVRVGAKVGAKDIIGFVGSSGESTGPHLDYRIAYHGKYVNPLGWKFRPAEPLRKEYKEPFTDDVEMLRIALVAPMVCLDLLLPAGRF
jgi:murein DD-endopeptidase MepM/ murein hydrolase activator NlpD